MGNKDRIIRWDDENNTHKYFVNGRLVGCGYDFLEVFEKAAPFLHVGREIVTRQVCLCDIDSDLSDTKTSMIVDFLNEAKRLTEFQEKALYEFDFTSLLELI